MPQQQPFDLFTYLSTHAAGILVFFLSLAGAIFLLQWTLWALGQGRFKRKDLDAATARSSRLRFLIADLLLKIIDDFRHLLALVIVLIFALALAVAIYIGRGSIDTLKEALQIVVATLGGLVGSIIGYYFGESAALKQPPGADAPTGATAGTQEAMQGEGRQPEAGRSFESLNIDPAPAPPPDAIEDNDAG